MSLPELRAMGIVCDEPLPDDTDVWFENSDGSLMFDEELDFSQPEQENIMLSVIGMIESENWMWAAVNTTDQYAAYRSSSNHTLKTVSVERNPSRTSGESFGNKDMSDLSWMNPLAENNRR